MFLALHEMRRAKVRFGLLMAAIGLLVFLILTQQALQNGLITSFVGAIERQSAPVLVYSVDGQRTLQGSVITPDLEATDRGGRRRRAVRAHRPGHVHGHVDGGERSDAALHRLRATGPGRARRRSAPGGCPRTRPARRSGARTTSRSATRCAVVAAGRRGRAGRRPGGHGGRPGRRRPDPGDPDPVRRRGTTTSTAVRAANPDATDRAPQRRSAMSPADGVTDDRAGRARQRRQRRRRRADPSPGRRRGARGGPGAASRSRSSSCSTAWWCRW